MRRGESFKDENKEQSGHQMKYRIVKNKIYSPFKEASTNLMYGVGIDRVDEVFQMALKVGHIRQGGAWFSYIDSETGEFLQIDGEEMKAQGREKMIELIRSTPLFYGELEDKIRGVEEIDMDNMTDEEVEEYKAANKEAGG